MVFTRSDDFILGQRRECLQKKEEGGSGGLNWVYLSELEHGTIRRASSRQDQFYIFIYLFFFRVQGIVKMILSECLHWRLREEGFAPIVDVVGVQVLVGLTIVENMEDGSVGQTGHLALWDWIGSDTPAVKIRSFVRIRRHPDPLRLHSIEGSIVKIEHDSRIRHRQNVLLLLLALARPRAVFVVMVVHNGKEATIICFSRFRRGIEVAKIEFVAVLIEDNVRVRVVESILRGDEDRSVGLALLIEGLKEGERHDNSGREGKSCGTNGGGLSGRDGCICRPCCHIDDSMH